MLLSVRDLTVKFRHLGETLTVVDHVNLTLEKGECAGIVGESGSGKSVTAKILLGLLKGPNVLVSGKVLLEDTDLLQLKNEALAEIRGKEISMIFQEPMTALNPVVSVFEQVAEPIRVHQPEVDEKGVEKRVFRAFERVGLSFGSEAKKLFPHELSGGMRQRVMIAMSIILEPKILIADEPTTALDVTVQAQILRLLRELNKEMGMSVFLISHDMAVISEMTQRLYVMYAGKVVEEGQTAAILGNRLHPYTEGLFQSIPDLNEKKTRLYAMPGSLPAPNQLPLGCSFSDRCPKKVSHCEKENPSLEVKKAGHRASCFEVQ